MTQFTFKKHEKPLTIEDINKVENGLGVKIPESLKRHYLKFNGGDIENAFIAGKIGSPDDRDDFRFIPMLYAKAFRDDPAFSMPLRTKQEWESGEVPHDLIPFAFYIGEYICINHQTGKVYYFERFNADQNPALLFNTFEEFLASIEVGEPPKPVVIKSHPYWGEIIEGWNGFATATKFIIPHFEGEQIEVFFGENESVRPPSVKQLDAYENTFSSFLDNLESILIGIKTSSVEYYQKYYAAHYEKPAESIEPLIIDSAEKHFEYIKRVNEIRVQKGNVIKISIDYALDIEHGIEFKILNNQVVRVGGIAET